MKGLDVPTKNIRNFCIISHIDHGKSTLADRFLELTNTIPKEKMKPQYLDMMDLEKEKGITIKMQPVSMMYELNGEKFLLNLIDTPGHVDFSYEVSRGLAATEGAILLVDVTKGIQAQTIGNVEIAKQQNLKIIPVINKIDLIDETTVEGKERIAQIEKEICSLLNIPSSNILKISAKKGINIENLLKEIIFQIPPPQQKSKQKNWSFGLIFDSKYDPFLGVIAFVRIFGGKIKKGDKIYLFKNKVEGIAKEVGMFKPELTPTFSLKEGEIGYVATGIKEAGKVRVGDTLVVMSKRDLSGFEPLKGYEEPQPKVFLSFYPENSDDFDDLKNGLEKLRLNDPALYFKVEFKEGLGRGFQCGFLGLLHAEITAERLKREFGLKIFFSSPCVLYKAILKNGKEVLIYSPADWPDPASLLKTQELWTKIEILVPLKYVGEVFKFLETIEGKYVGMSQMGEKAKIIYETPLREIFTKNFYDKLKSVSQGFASMNYQILGWRDADLVKLDILILGKREEAFSKIVPKSQAYKEGKRTVEKLKEILPAQLFAVPLQAAIGGKIIARATIKAKRRDVTAPLYGGDYTRKMKLLERQKRGKEKLKERAQIRIPSKVFLEMLKEE